MHQESEFTLVFAELAVLLRRINESLQPNKLGLVGKSEAYDFVLTVERMKVLVEKLEILRMMTDSKRTT
jgi:hypothetical protein